MTFASSALEELSLKWAKLNLSRTTRTRIWMQLSRMMRNKIQLLQALDELWQRFSQEGRKPQHPVALAIDSWRREVANNGHKFALAVQGWIPQHEQMLIEAGETSGNLPGALDRAVELSRSTARMRATLIAGFAYPIVLFAFLLGVLVLISHFIIPPFAQLLPMEEWRGLPLILAHVSGFVRDWLLVVLVAAAALVGLIMASMTRWTGPWRTWFDKVPPWSLYRLWQGTSFLLSMSALLRANVALPSILRRLREIASPWLAERLDATLWQVGSGHSLGEALSRTGMGFPDGEIVRDLVVYSQLGAIEDSVESIANDWLEESISRIQTGARFMNAVMIILVAGALVSLIAGMFLLQQQFAESVGI